MLNVQWLTWDKTTLQMDGVEQFTWAGAWEENWERRIQGFEKQPESQKNNGRKHRKLWFYNTISYA